MGRPTEVSVDDVCEYVEELGEPVIVREVADALDCGTSTAREKLLLAVEHGRMHTKSPGERTRIFWMDEDCQ